MGDESQKTARLGYKGQSGRQRLLCVRGGAVQLRHAMDRTLLPGEPQHSVAFWARIKFFANCIWVLSVDRRPWKGVISRLAVIALEIR